MTNNPIPSFERPPVVETVLGVSFDPIVGWSIPYHGLFWNTVRAELPNTQSQQPLDVVIEPNQVGSTFDQLFTPRVQLINIPKARCWFFDDSEHNLVQVQQDRFIFNWRKNQKAVEYPRYTQHVRPNFLKYWEKFCQFIESESNLSNPEVTQCEVTYFNHFLKEDLESGWSDILGSFQSSLDSKFLPPTESLRFNQTFAMPDGRGRLRISGYPGLRKSDAAELLILELTARGRPKSSTTTDVLGWLDIGREWIVRGFKDLTTAKMHKRWGLLGK